MNKKIKQLLNSNKQFITYEQLIIKQLQEEEMKEYLNGLEVLKCINII